MLQKAGSFTFYGCLLWKLANVPFLVVSKAEIGRWFGSGCNDSFFPALFKDLMFRAAESNYGVLSYQKAKIKKKKKAKNEKGAVCLITLIIMAVHIFSLLAQLIKTMIILQ